MQKQLKQRQITMVGGTGFVGTYVAEALVREGYHVKLLTRQRDHRKESLLVLPTADVVEVPKYSQEVLTKELAGSYAVIYLSGILNENNSGDFQKIHVQLPEMLMNACKENGINRYLHMSALGASEDAPSKYLTTKGQAETLVKASGLDYTIFRPSVIFGRGDNFITMFANLHKILPMIFLVSHKAKFQPVYVEDVANAIVYSLDDKETYSKSYDLAGVKTYTLKQIVRLAGEATGNPKPIWGLCKLNSFIVASLMSLSPIKLITLDNYKSMKVDNVCPEGTNGLIELHIYPTAMEAVVPTYINNETPRGKYNEFRERAGR